MEKENKQDDIEKLFDHLKDDFDLEIPTLGHEHRFLNKLNAASKKPKKNRWIPLLGIAASIALIFSVFLFTAKQENGLASVSPKMAETEAHFSEIIAEELEKFNDIKSPKTEKIIKDAMKQLAKAEKEYKVLKQDLKESENDKRVVYAMINNFQNRITILKNTLEKIEQINQLNTQNHENTI